MEEWRDIPEYEGRYQVSNLGKVKNVESNYILKPNYSHGYKYVHFCHKGSKRKNKAIHRLVAMTFFT